MRDEGDLERNLAATAAGRSDLCARLHITAIGLRFAAGTCFPATAIQNQGLHPHVDLIISVVIRNYPIMPVSITGASAEELRRRERILVVQSAEYRR